MRALFLWLFLSILPAVATAYAQPEARIGVVLMHGKGGSPQRHVQPLASALEAGGILVSNLEMPWSGRRNYDADVAAAERQVSAALAALKAKGAQKVFVAGHSQGGVFALNLASRLPMNGVAAIAPGGNVGNRVFRENLGGSVAQAQRAVAEGKGGEPQRFYDYEGARGAYPVVVAPQVYLTWFDPEGAMNQVRAAKAVPANVPVLYVAPSNDYPALQRVKQSMFELLPANPLTRLYQPQADHLRAPGAAAEELARWMRTVANSPAP